MNFKDEELWTLYDALLIAISSVQNDINNGKYKGRPDAQEHANAVIKRMIKVSRPISSKLYSKEQT